MGVRSLIPSMFHRRLLLILLLIVSAMSVLVARLFHLTVVQGHGHLEAAEAALIDEELLPTYRGRILDRLGRILSLDRPSVDVLVDYRLISGEWVTTQAAETARRADPVTWAELSPGDRAALIRSREPELALQLDRVWDDLADAAEVSREELDAAREQIRQRVEGMALHIWERWRKRQEEEFQTKVSIEEVARPIQEQRQPHPLILAVPFDREADLTRIAVAGPMISRSVQGITIRHTGARHYPFRQMQVEVDRTHLPLPIRSDVPLSVELENVAGHLLGTVRTQVYVEDVQRRPMRSTDGSLDLKGYHESTDVIGSTGVERAMEDRLRGARGIIVRHLDTGLEDQLQARPGDDVTLTIDVILQAKVQALLDPQIGLTVVQPWHGRENRLPLGMTLNAAVVILDIQSGEILALVSHPSAPSQEPDTPNRPWAFSTMDAGHVNGAVEVPCPPGSIVKPLLLCGAVTARVWTVNRTIECQGHLYPNDPLHYRCWIFRPNSPGRHGPLDAVGALARSCNIYFYTIGRAMGPELERYWYEQWGVGREFNIGLPVLARRMPPAAQITASEEIMLGIGQGKVEWTPLHAAVAYAALARGGRYQEPTLIRHGERPQTIDLVIDDSALAAAMQGLDDVVNNRTYGGARHLDVDGPGGAAPAPIFDVEGVRVWGKTGTAQQAMPQDVRGLVNQLEEATGDEETAVPNADQRSLIGAHSWFVGLAGQDAGVASPPRYVISVFVEWGGSGSRCAAPIANAVIAAMQQEGLFR